MSDAGTQRGGRRGLGVGGLEEFDQRAGGGPGGAQIVGGEGGADLLRTGRAWRGPAPTTTTPDGRSARPPAAGGQEQADARQHGKAEPTGKGKQAASCPADYHDGAKAEKR